MRVQRAAAFLVLYIGLAFAGCARPVRDCGTIEPISVGVYLNPTALHGASANVRCLSDAYATREPARATIVIRQLAGGATWRHDVLFDGFEFRVDIDGPDAVDVRNSANDFFYVIGDLALACERLEREPAPLYASLEGETVVIAGCSDPRVPVVHVGFLPRDVAPPSARPGR
jgi:hypothetical protein